MMKWFRNKQAHITAPAVQDVTAKHEEPTKPPYYSVTRKEVLWVSNDIQMWRSGQAWVPSWYAIQADIYQRGNKNILATVSASFEKMGQEDKALSELQDNIHEKIKTFLAKDALIQKLHVADTVNNGLEWFIK